MITKGIAIFGSRKVAIIGKDIVEKPNPVILLRKAAKKNDKNMETIKLQLIVLLLLISCLII